MQDSTVSEVSKSSANCPAVRHSWPVSMQHPAPGTTCAGNVPDCDKPSASVKTSKPPAMPTKDGRERIKERGRGKPRHRHPSPDQTQNRVPHGTLQACTHSYRMFHVARST